MCSITQTDVTSHNRIVDCTPNNRDNAIRYVLPVLWKTSCFHIMSYMVSDVGNNDLDAVRGKISSQNFQRFCQVAPPRSLTLSLYTVAANGAPGARCDVHDGLAFLGVARAPPMRGSAVDQNWMQSADLLLAVVSALSFVQCFDTVGWVTGRSSSGLYK